MATDPRARVPDEDAADLVLTGGRLQTVDALLPVAEALAVADGRIVAVGAAEDVLGFFRGERTQVLDVEGRTVLPGFQDAHVHPPMGGLEMLRCDLAGQMTLDAYLATIRAYAAAEPAAPWILGGGWEMAAFPGGTPHRRDLDAVLGSRPAFLPNRDHHGAWVNSAALAIAGVDRHTPDPVDGRIERDADGEPTGTLHEGAMDLVLRHIPPTTDDEWVAALGVAQAHLHALGITAWQDAIVGGPYDAFEAYLRFASSGDLTARVVLALWWERARGPEQIEGLVARRDRARAAGLDAATVKIMQDGVAENFTAAMLAPYLDAQGRPTDNAGISFVAPDALREAIVALDAEGFQVHVHALGDRAVREALDAIGAARAANGMNDLRHHLAHLQVVHPDDVPRFRAVGAGANLQMLWATNEPQMTELTIPFLGPERSRWQYPFASLVSTGIPVCAGSDWPVSSADPFRQIAVGVHRRHPRSAHAPGPATDQPFLPEQAITLDAAIEAFTLGSAWANRLDDATGSLSLGKWADLVILDRDLSTQDLEGLGETRVEATFVGGRPVHAVGAFAGLAS